MKKGIIYSFIISLIICMIMPFNLHADTISNSEIVGYNIVESTQANLTLEMVLNRPFVGNYIVDVKYTYSTGNLTKRYTFYFNGTSSISSQSYNMSPISLNNLSFTKVDSTGFFADDQIEGFPYESNNLILGMLYNGWQPRDLINLPAQFEFPIFDIQKNSYQIVWDLYSSTDNDPSYYKCFIFGLGIISGSGAITDDSSFKNYFKFEHRNDYVDVTNDFQVISAETLFRSMVKPGLQMRVYKVVYKRVSNTDSGFSGQYSIRYNNDTSNIFLPIYFNYEQNTNISTDFALRFGLRNVEVDYYLGSPESQTSSDNLEDSSDDLSSNISSYNQIESDYNNQMNQALNNIDFSDQFSNNQNFLSGASFVKTVFNSFMQIDILRIFFIVLCIVLIAKRFI